MTIERNHVVFQAPIGTTPVYNSLVMSTIDPAVVLENAKKIDVRGKTLHEIVTGFRESKWHNHPVGIGWPVELYCASIGLRDQWPYKLYFLVQMAHSPQAYTDEALKEAGLL